MDKQPSISTCGRDSPMESERQAPGIGKTRREDDQSVKMDGVASSSGWDMDTGNMLTCSRMRRSQACGMLTLLSS